MFGWKVAIFAVGGAGVLLYVLFLLPGNVFGQASTVDLVSHYLLDETSGTTASDAADTNHGTLHGDATRATSQVAAAIQLDGNGDYVEVPDDFDANRLMANWTG